MDTDKIIENTVASFAVMVMDYKSGEEEHIKIATPERARAIISQTLESALKEQRGEIVNLISLLGVTDEEINEVVDNTKATEGLSAGLTTIILYASKRISKSVNDGWRSQRDDLIKKLSEPI